VSTRELFLDETASAKMERSVPQSNVNDADSGLRCANIRTSPVAFRSAATVDTCEPTPNNAVMPKPETVRRIKSYSAASGFVYQYQFQDVHPASRAAATGNEYVYYVSADRKMMFPVRIFVSRDALENWTKETGRGLTGTEEYALAKMRLFEALDEFEDFASKRPELTVDESNIGTLLERLDL
jgi:hypothetical protein